MDSKRKKVVWLPGWYPSAVNVQNGDFIQRHALAASKFADIAVVFAEKDFSLKEGQKIEVIRDKGLVCFIGYYSAKKGIFNTFFSVIKYYVLLFKLYNLSIKEFEKFDFVHVVVPLKQSLLALKLNYFKNAKIIVSEHNSCFLDKDNSFESENYFLKWMIKKVFSVAGKVHVVSNVLGKALLLRKIISIPPLVIPNVVNTNAFRGSADYKSINEINFVTVIGDTFIKNSDGVLRAWSKALATAHHTVKLHVIGPNAEALDLLAAELKIKDTVQFYGMISNEEVADVMKRADSAILFSRYETFGCVMAEALCCGLTVIASDLPVFKEQLADMVNAIFVRQENEQELAAAIVFFINNRTVFDREMISHKAALKFNNAVVGKQIADLYI